MKYFYGMRLRGFSPGAQPMNGLYGVTDYKLNKWEKKSGRKYHDVLVYLRKLDDKELEEYELDYLGEAER